MAPRTGVGKQLANRHFPLAVITQNPMTPQERRAVGSLALLYAFRMLGLFMVLPLLALYAADMPGATPTMLGLALGVYGLSQALLQIPLGWLSDRIGRKPVIIGGLIVFGIGSLVAASADSVGGIVFGRVLQGAGAIASTVMALVADLTSAQQRTKAMALVGMSIGLSFAVALILGPVVASVGGLSGVFAFTAVLAVIGIFIVYLLVPTPQSKSSGGDALARAGHLSQALRDLGLLRLNVGVFILHFILMACFLMVPAGLEVIVGVDRDHHWQVYLPVLVLSVVAMMPLMILAERKQQMRMAFLIGIFLVPLGIGILGSVGSPALFVFGLWLFFVGFNYLEATLPSLVSKTGFEGGRGTAMGVFSTSQFMGAFFGGAAGGWILQHYHEGGLVLVCVLLGLLWWIIVHRSSQPLVAVADTAA